jgi:hypothetical protein
MTTPDQLLAWAKLTHETFGCSIEEALERAAAWSKPEPEAAPQHPIARGHITRIAARGLRSGITCELMDGRLMTPERRRLVLEVAKSMKTHSPTLIAKRLFDLSGFDSKEKANLMRAIGDDIVHHRTMGALENQPSAKPKESPGNGPAEEELPLRHQSSP